MTCIDWASNEGRERLQRSRYAGAFYRLAHCFQPQIRPTYCAVASAVIVLNALRLGQTGLRLHDGALHLQKPDGSAMTFNAYTQLHFFDECNEAVKRQETIEGKGWLSPEEFNPGMNLSELSANLRLQLCRVRCNPMESLADDACRRFRQDVMAYINDSKSFLIVNFDGRLLGKDVGGHFSPLAAYDEISDSVLVIDVAGHKHPWFWVPIGDLCRAMHSLDGSSYRGWLVVEDRLQRRRLK